MPLLSVALIEACVAPAGTVKLPLKFLVLGSAAFFALAEAPIASNFVSAFTADTNFVSILDKVSPEMTV